MATAHELTQEMVRISMELSRQTADDPAASLDRWRRKFSVLIESVKNGDEDARLAALTEIAGRIPKELIETLDASVFDDPPALLRRLAEARSAIGQTMDLVTVLLMETAPKGE